jgi:hypothetical protein
MAITALVLGIISIVVTLVFDAGFLIAIPLALTALVLGVVSGRKSSTASEDLQTGTTWTAKAGALTGGIGLLLCTFWWVPFIGVEINIWRLNRPAPRFDVSDLASHAEVGSFVEVTGVVAGVEHMPGHPTVILRSSERSGEWRAVCVPLAGRLPSPEPDEGRPSVIRGRVKQIDTNMAEVFGKQIRLEPCLIVGR